MNTNGIFDKHRPKLLWEAILLSAFRGMTVGFIASFIVALITWFSPVEGLWIALGVFCGVSIIASFVFYFARYRLTEVKNARRLDRLGLHERLITMVEYHNDKTPIAQLQRDDARTTLSKLDPKSVKILIPRAVVSLLLVCAIMGSGMITVNALSDAGLIKGGDEILDEIIEDQTTEYVTVSYVAEDGGIIEGDEDQIIIKGTDALTVTAVAEDGYVFKEWSDGYTYPTRTDKNITEDVIYTAVFTELGDDEGEGDGEGDEGEGEGDESQDQPSDESQGEQQQDPTEGEPNSDANLGGGAPKPEDQIINNETHYRDVISDLEEKITERVENSDGSLTQEEIDMINKYLGIV